MLSLHPLRSLALRLRQGDCLDKPVNFPSNLVQHISTNIALPSDLGCTLVPWRGRADGADHQPTRCKASGHAMETRKQRVGNQFFVFTWSYVRTHKGRHVKACWETLASFCEAHEDSSCIHRRASHLDLGVSGPRMQKDTPSPESEFQKTLVPS